MFYTKAFLNEPNLFTLDDWILVSPFLWVFMDLESLWSVQIFIFNIYLFIYLFFTLNFVLLLKRCIFTEFAFSEAVTCKRECLAPHTRCVIRQGTEEICLCIPECPKEIKHVCGSDKVTYNNMCLLEKAACENNKVITVVKTGRCQGISLVRDCH